MVQSNLGKTDRVLRFLVAFWWLGPWAPQYAATWFNWLLFALGWLALVESMLGYCWLLHALGVKNKD